MSVINRARPMRGVAEERIPAGSSVLCRMNRVTLAAPELANGVARPVPPGRSFGVEDPETHYDAGQVVIVDPLVGLDVRDLKALAAAPLMDPIRLYLPAGKISEAECRARERANLTVVTPPS